MMREELQNMRQMEEVTTGDLEEQVLPEVIEENGLIYHLAEDGCYYPDLTFEQETDYLIGKYGLIRAEYMWEHKAHEYRMMLQDGTWNRYLHEVDEECLNTLSGSPVSMEEATEIVAGKVPGSSAADVTIWEESGDGRGRYEGELFFDGMKFEFEIDPQTGRIFDWNADLRD